MDFSFLKGGSEKDDLKTAGDAARVAAKAATSQRRKLTPTERAAVEKHNSLLDTKRKREEAARDTPEQRQREEDALLSSLSSQHRLKTDPLIRIKLDKKGTPGGKVVHKSEGQKEADRQYGERERRDMPFRAALRTFNDKLSELASVFVPKSVLPEPSHIHDDTHLGQALDVGVGAARAYKGYKGGAYDGPCQSRMTRQEIVEGGPAPCVPRQDRLSNPAAYYPLEMESPWRDLPATQHYAPVCRGGDSRGYGRYMHGGPMEYSRSVLLSGGAAGDSSDEDGSSGDEDDPDLHSCESDCPGLDDYDLDGGALMSRKAHKRKKKQDEYFKLWAARRAAGHALQRRTIRDMKEDIRAAKTALEPGNPFLETAPGLAQAQRTWLGSPPVYIRDAMKEYRKVGDRVKKLRRGAT